MLFDYTYLLQNFDADFFNESNGNIRVREFIIPINEKITGSNPELFKILFNSGSRFCFLIPITLTQYDNNFIKEEIIQNVVRLLFLPNYMRIDGKYIFFVEKVKEENKNFEDHLNEFCNELKKQGIDDILVEIIQTEPSAENMSNEKSISFFHPDFNNYLSNDKEGGIFETFAEKFIVPANFHKQWIVPVTDFDSYLHKAQLIEKFENWIRRTNPFIVQLIEMFKRASGNVARLESENKILKFKLENSAVSLKLIREEAYNYISEVSRLRHEVHRLAQQTNGSATNFPISISPTLGNVGNEVLLMELQTQIDAEQNRANEILAWYKKEYEVLPVWYKKFGHIIKVFIGKRTFKSLFK